MELENAYKLIKHLQNDLNLFKSKSESINYIEKLQFSDLKVEITSLFQNSCPRERDKK